MVTKNNDSGEADKKMLMTCWERWIILWRRHHRSWACRWLRRQPIMLLQSTLCQSRC